MSFPRHEGIFRSDGRGSCRSGARSERLHAPTHRLDEFPTGYSSAGWSPPEPASASPAEQKFTMKAAPQPSLFQRMGKPCLAGCLTTGVHPSAAYIVAIVIRRKSLSIPLPALKSSALVISVTRTMFVVFSLLVFSLLVFSLLVFSLLVFSLLLAPCTKWNFAPIVI